MKKLLELGNRYAKESTWVDFAVVKFCLSAMGILIGIHVKDKDKKIVGMAALSIFVATYIPLMVKVFGIIKKMMKQTNK